MKTAHTANSGLTNGYCTDCNACGHSGCCSPLDCKMTNNCTHCSKYLGELKAGYQIYEQIFSLVYADTQKYAQLIEAFEKIREEAEEAWEKE